MNEKEIIGTDIVSEINPIENYEESKEMINVEEPVSGNIVIGDDNCASISMKNESPTAFRYFITKKNKVTGVIMDHILYKKLYANLVDIDDFDISEYLVRDFGDIVIYINRTYVRCVSKLRMDYLAFLMPKMGEHFENKDNTFVAEDNLIVCRADKTDIDDYYRSEDEECFVMYDLRSANLTDEQKEELGIKDE